MNESAHIRLMERLSKEATDMSARLRSMQDSLRVDIETVKGKLDAGRPPISVRLDMQAVLHNRDQMLSLLHRFNNKFERLKNLLEICRTESVEVPHAIIASIEAAGTVLDGAHSFLVPMQGEENL